ncbi:MAG TPA: YraN family protein [Syntrophales bacterium]|nr:YraN family protein [Syntrophales bacterium]
MKVFDKALTGKKGEDTSITYLKSRLYRIVERNYICPLAEIDIVAGDGDAIVLVQVKSTKSEEFGDPQLA